MIGLDLLNPQKVFHKNRANLSNRLTPGNLNNFVRSNRPQDENRTEGSEMSELHSTPLCGFPGANFRKFGLVLIELKNALYSEP
jgi:hypothetical protein